MTEKKVHQLSFIVIHERGCYSFPIRVIIQMKNKAQVITFYRAVYIVLKCIQSRCVIIIILVKIIIVIYIMGSLGSEQMEDFFFV